MSGDATFTGTTYQARVIAVVYAHVLAQARLYWSGLGDDTPLAVWGETNGVGDDARIELGEGRASIEVQAKHGLGAGAELDSVLDRMVAQQASGGAGPIVLAIDRSSTRSLSTTFARDLERLRGGRNDGLSAEMKRVRARLGAGAKILDRFYVCEVEVDRPGDAGVKHALQSLEGVLEDKGQAGAAWSVLVEDAGDLCANRRRRVRKDLVDLLADRGIKVRPAAKDDQWHRRLEFTKRLLFRGLDTTAVAELRQLETDLRGTRIEAFTQYRLAQQRAAAELRCQRPRTALEYAQRALDADPKGLHAMIIAAAACVALGDLPRAVEYAEAGGTAHPEDGLAWGSRAYVASAAGDQCPQPPRAAAESIPFLVNAAHLAAANDEHKRAVMLAEQVFARGDRPADLLFLVANSMLHLATAAAATSGERYEKAERLATELIEVHAASGHPLVVKAFVIRAGVRRSLGRLDEAEADLAEARELSNSDPDALRQASQARFDAGDIVGAIDLLRHPVVDTDLSLLSVRAKFLGLHGDVQRAATDLAGVTKCIEDAENGEPEAVLIYATEAALVLKDVATAQMLLGKRPHAEQNAEYWAVLEGRLAFLRGDPAAGAAAFRTAVAFDGTRKHGWLEELGTRLLHANQPGDAAKVYQEVGLPNLSEPGLRTFASALMQSNELSAAEGIVEHLRSRGRLPDWAVQLAAHLALLQEDSEGAAALLADLLSRGNTSLRARLDLIRALVDAERLSEANAQVDSIIAEPAGLVAIERALVAQLLNVLGRPDEAFLQAFRAYRDAPQDPRTHRAFIGIALTGRPNARLVESTGPDTFVRLRSDSGTAREHVIYSTDPVDPLRHEMKVSDAEAAGLLGKRVGEILVRDKGSWTEETWTVEEILPAETHAVRDAMAHFEDRFPKENFFVKGFRIGDGTGVADFAPLIASLQARKRQGEMVFRLYREHMLPLGFVAQVMGVTIPDVMRFATALPEAERSLPTEWVDVAGQHASRQAAAIATEVVLTRSALQTLFELELCATIQAAYSLVAPRSLLRELRDESREATERLALGQSTLVGTDAGPRVLSQDPGSPTLVDAVESLKRQTKWIEENVRLMPRPLSAVGIAEPEEGLREQLGRSSADAIDLMRAGARTLFADDLGLRRLVAPNRSFSTIGLVRGLADRSALSSVARDAHLLTLVARRHSWVLPTVQLLDCAIRQSGRLISSKTRDAFELLVGPAMTPNDAAELASGLLKVVATAVVQILSPEEVAELVLQAMTTRWPARLCALVLRRSVADALVLFPQVVAQVDRVAVRFVQHAMRV